MSIIDEIDAEISRLRQAKAILAGTATSKGPGRPKKTETVPKVVAVAPTKRVMSAEGRVRVAEAQRTRWARSKREDKKVATRTALAKSIPATKARTKKAVTVAKSAKPVKATKVVKENKPQI
jgi:hypothetical protein